MYVHAHSLHFLSDVMLIMYVSAHEYACVTTYVVIINSWGNIRNVRTYVLYWHEWWLCDGFKWLLACVCNATQNASLLSQCMLRMYICTYVVGDNFFESETEIRKLEHKLSNYRTIIGQQEEMLLQVCINQQQFGWWLYPGMLEMHSLQAAEWHYFCISLDFPH